MKAKIKVVPETYWVFKVKGHEISLSDHVIKLVYRLLEADMDKAASKYLSNIVYLPRDCGLNHKKVADAIIAAYKESMQ